MGTQHEQGLQEHIPQGISVADVEGALRAIPGVEACRLVTDKDLKIIELHALADTGRSPKQIVRDIQATLVTRFGIRIDYRKIGVAQLRDEGYEMDERELLSRHRLRIRKMSLATKDRNMSCSVTLGLGERAYEGRAEGPQSSNSGVRLMITATFRAVEEVLRGAVRFVLDEIREFNVSGKTGIIVSLVACDESGETPLVGGAMVKDTVVETAARATMDAINGYLARLGDGHPGLGAIIKDKY